MLRTTCAYGTISKNMVIRLFECLSFGVQVGPTNSYRIPSGNIVPLNANSKNVVIVRWRPSMEGWVSLNIDGSTRSQWGLVGCGWLIRDVTCKWICGFLKRVGISYNLRCRPLGVDCLCGKRKKYLNRSREKEVWDPCYFLNFFS